jgi:hypothetical protein
MATPEDDTIICVRCVQEKPIAQFRMAMNRGYGPYRISTCNACVQKLHVAYQLKKKGRSVCNVLHESNVYVVEPSDNKHDERDSSRTDGRPGCRSEDG